AQNISLAVTKLNALAAPLSAAAQNVGRLVEYVAQTANILRTKDLAAAFYMPVRQVQRLLRDRLGLSPKNVIDRFAFMMRSAYCKAKNSQI
ncbi:MAG: hypothetical protein JKX69_03925, partial [Rhodobacteraceae bacterium]|nr:hypothetical protein [Paracoccaceae bacterium]